MTIWRDHITPLLLRERHWLPIQQRIDYKLCVMVHHCLHERATFYLLELITPSAAAHSRARLRSAESRTVAVPRTLSSLGDRAFAVAAPRTWNSLPFFIRSVDTVDCFKKNLESYLSNVAFKSWYFAYIVFTAVLTVWRLCCVFISLTAP